MLMCKCTQPGSETAKKPTCGDLKMMVPKVSTLKHDNNSSLNEGKTK